MNREALIDRARAAVLDALDNWAREEGLPNLGTLAPGATDGDLPALFPAIDAQVDRLIARSGLLLPDYPPTSIGEFA